MKKLTILFVFCMIAGTTSTFAQGFGLGLKGGANFAKVDQSGVDGKTGYHFGAYGKLMFSDGFGLQPEILWSARGAKDLDLNYIDVPILLRFKLFGPLNFHAGPQFAILTSAEDPSGSIKDQMKSSEFSLAAGVGVELPLGLSGSFRYVHGLSDANDVGNSVKASMFQLSVGFQLIGLGD